MQVTVNIESKFSVDYSLFIYEVDTFQKSRREVETILEQKDSNQLQQIATDLAKQLNDPIDYRSKILYAENTFISDLDKIIDLYRQRVENKLIDVSRGNFSFTKDDESYEVTIHLLNWYVQRQALVADMKPLWFTDFRFRFSDHFTLKSVLWQKACKIANRQQLTYSDKFIETATFLEKLVVFFNSDFLKEIYQTDWNKVNVQRFTDQLVLNYFRNDEAKYLTTTEFY